MSLAFSILVSLIVVLTVLGTVNASSDLVVHEESGLESIFPNNIVDDTFCSVSVCGDRPTEIERWECVGRALFRPVNTTSLSSRKASRAILNHKYVEHDCGGVGWGNSIRGYYNAAALGALLSRRVTVVGPRKIFNKVFLPPYDDVDSWDYGMEEANRQLSKNAYQQREVFEYEKYGRAPNRFDEFSRLVQKGPKEVPYKKTVLQAGICGGEREFLVKGNCMARAMPGFVGCAASTTQDYLHEHMLSIPFFHTLFSRPAPILAETLAIIRERVGLPQLEPGLEEKPGLWGLHTPGYYIFALHFRRVPIGFEPMAFEISENKRHEKFKMEVLEGFWKQATQLAKQARSIAKCRGEKFIIYFATDDVENLRPEAKKRLSSIGKVVFGLEDDEVGHVSPQWSHRDIERVQQEMKATTSITGEAMEVVTSSSNDPETAEIDDMKRRFGLKNRVANVGRSEADVEKHGIMSMIEWWILAQSQWLVSHSGTSYSDSAAGFGMGPKGFMERLDVVHGRDHASTSFRREWNTAGCPAVGAKDPQQAAACPNVKM